MSRVVVDCHSHIFNAEDLPIDGFIKRQSPLPALLTGVLSLPLDRLSAWAAPGSKEAELLVAMIAHADGRESAPGDAGPVAAATGEELIADAELDRRLVEMWPLALPPAGGGLESVGLGVDDHIAERIATSTPEQRAELDAWLRERGDPEADRALAHQDAGLESFADLTAKARAVRRGVHRFVDALRLITRHRHLVAAAVAATYPEVRLFVPALVDFDRTARDRPSTPVHEQVMIHSLVAKLSVVGGIPEAPDVRVHPFVAFCPYREIERSELAGWDIERGTANPYVPYADPVAATDADRFTPDMRFDAARAKPLRRPAGPWRSARLELTAEQRSLDLVRHAVELGGFAGVKLYPPAGFLPIGNVARFGERVGARLDAALRALYGYCVAQNVPILTHAAHSNGFETGYDDLASPAGWEQVLRDYPTLRICFGHFGHQHGVGTVPAQPSAGSWPVRFLELVDAYPHVYADVGNSRYIYDKAYRDGFDAFLGAALGPRQTTDQPFVKRRLRLMFGSDYWMNTLGPEHDRALDVFTSGIEKQFGPDVADGFLGKNALRWLGLADDDDVIDQSRSAAVRLVDFYGGHPTPDWLGG